MRLLRVHIYSICDYILADMFVEPYEGIRRHFSNSGRIPQRPPVSVRPGRSYGLVPSGTKSSQGGEIILELDNEAFPLYASIKRGPYEDEGGPQRSVPRALGVPPRKAGKEAQAKESPSSWYIVCFRLRMSLPSWENPTALELVSSNFLCLRLLGLYEGEEDASEASTSWGSGGAQKIRRQAMLTILRQTVLLILQ
jgi:hypothetical protein